MTIHGYMIDVDWNDPTLTVTAKTGAARVALLGPGHKNDGPLVITRDQMATVTFKDANPLINGNLVITAADGAKYQLHFRRKQRDDFRKLADVLGATL